MEALPAVLARLRGLDAGTLGRHLAALGGSCSVLSQPGVTARGFAQLAAGLGGGSADDAQSALAERRGSNARAGPSSPRGLQTAAQPQLVDPAPLFLEPDYAWEQLAQQHHHHNHQQHYSQQQHYPQHHEQPYQPRQQQPHLEPPVAPPTPWQQEQRKLLEQEIARRQAAETSRNAALAAAPEDARPTLQTLATLLELKPKALSALAVAVSRNARQVGGAVEWVDPDAAVEIATALLGTAGLSAADVADVLTRCPGILRMRPNVDPITALELLQQHVSSSSSRSGSGYSEQDAAAPPSTGDLVRRAPHLLRTPVPQLESNLSYLARTLRLPGDALHAAVAQHPLLVTVAPGVLATNLGFFVGLGVSADALRGMVAASPQWATMPLRELAMRWQFFRQELKCTPEDVVMMPDLLKLSLLDILGPRAGLARKRRIKLLLPSYTSGHPVLQQPAEWAALRMAPVLWWMKATPQQLCAVMGFDLDELLQYQAAWRMTSGDKWRRMVLSPTAGGGGGSRGDGSAPPSKEELLQTPPSRVY